jgi:hypothetical protein
MALSTDQQSQADIQLFVQKEMEQIRHQNMMALEQKRAEAEARRAKLETLRVAKEIITENSRSKPVESREVTAADITAFAAALEAHLNG